MPIISRLIRSVPGPELCDYFTSFGIAFPDPVNWDGGGGELIEPLLKAVDTLTEIQCERICLDCERIDRMTSEVGQTAIMSVADEAQQDRLRTIGIRHARALWLLRTDPAKFCRAEDVAFFENARKGRTWDAFVAPKDLIVGRGDDRRNALAAEVRRFFREGEKVKIEVFDRTRPDVDGGVKSLVQVMVYREGLPDSVDVFQDQDSIGPLVYRPVYELGFTYEAASGVIEVVGDRKADRRDLAKVFAKTLLNHSVDAAPLPLRQYDLSAFMTDHRFATDPQDGIGIVRVRVAKFETLDESAFLTIEARAADDNVHSLASQLFEERNPFLGGYRIREVVLSVPFEPDDINPRGRTISLKLRHPNGCDLKDKTDKERLIGEKYLRRWGILQEMTA